MRNVMRIILAMAAIVAMPLVTFPIYTLSCPELNCPTEKSCSGDVIRFGECWILCATGDEEIVKNCNQPGI